MVEELARWKAALSQKAIDLQDIVQKLLEERCKIRSSLLDCHRFVTSYLRKVIPFGFIQNYLLIDSNTFQEIVCVKREF